MFKMGIWFFLSNLIFCFFLRWDGVKAGPKTATANPTQSIDIIQNVQPRRSGCCGS
jgi:hypothetical protein